MVTNALRKLRHDDRDFKHHIVFGSVSSTDLPTHDFLVSVPLEIKNQDINYETDYCTAYAATEVAEDEAQVVFCPEWTFAQAKAIIAEIEGVSAYSDFGLDLRDICKAAQLKGFLPRLRDPFKCDTMNRPERSVLVNPSNWPSICEMYARPYKVSSYFSVTGYHDLFDNIRAAMWLHLGERRSVITGCMWRHSWSQKTDGIIPKVYEHDGVPHAFKFCGQKTINGEVYLIAQLSEGKTFGDNGFYYFPREVVNRECAAYGAFVFSSLPENKALWYVTNGVSIYDNFITKAFRFVANLIHI